MVRVNHRNKNRICQQGLPRTIWIMTSRNEEHKTHNKQKNCLNLQTKHFIFFLKPKKVKKKLKNYKFYKFFGPKNRPSLHHGKLPSLWNLVCDKKPSRPEE
jgi:hypothetical protein